MYPDISIRLGDRFEQICFHLPHQLHPFSPVAEEFSGEADVILLVEASKQRANILGHAPKALFSGHWTGLRVFLCCKVHPAVERYSPRSRQPVQVADVGTPHRSPYLVASPRHNRDEVGFLYAF